ncbi:MAG: sensor histidine kinase, partial [Burkholderiaceae bacterium]
MRRDLDRAALLLIAALWTLHFLMMTARLGAKEFEHWADYTLSRLALSLCGAVFTIGVFVLLRRRRSLRFRYQAQAAALLSAVAAIAITLVNIHAFREISPASEVREYYLLFLHAFMYWYWFYLSWAAAYLALSYSFTVAEQERRSATLVAQAHEAQVRALRYQVHPHFLFNALNSIASLIDERPGQAEEMAVKLSDLLRSSLLLDPLQEISLSEELGLQQKYLEIERVRFPDRLDLEIDVPAELGDVRVPCLLLQPLVENAVRHGVARSDRRTAIRIAAWREGGSAVIQVSNDIPAAATSAPDRTGTGIGLTNVRRRLEARFGAEQSMRVESTSG